jgi:putative transposase
MFRKTRADAPGALHHIIIRRIERKPIFKAKIDYGNFIDRLGKILVDTGIDCFAWALITNHAHFLFRTGMVPISTVMRRLLTGMLNSSIVTTSAMDIFSKTGINWKWSDDAA